MHTEFAKTVENMMAPSRACFEHWISFFPTAPLFGVEWRFAPTDAWNLEVAAVYHDEDEAAEPEATVAEAVAGTVAVEPEIVAEAPDVAPEAPAADDLKRIRGIGPRLAEELNSHGIHSFAQLAALSADELARLDAALTTIKGRCYRDDWVGQAKALMG